MISVQKVTSPKDLETVFQIRQKVFVEEQNVPLDEEYDEFEKLSQHYLALYNGLPAGVSRWRETDKGVKLERFAVLKEFRNKDVGGEILNLVLEDVNAAHKNKQIYLHAQLRAVPFYERHGFQKVGDQFSECDILHYKMIYKN